MALRLSLLFGTYYFVQGIAEPSAGLPSQPIKSLLAGWGWDSDKVGIFMGTLHLPWTFKPLYGILTDFFPILRRRRKSYLILTSSTAALVLLMLYFTHVPRGAGSLLLSFLFSAGLAMAFSDVVIDAVMIEKGQPLGLTGRLQSVQWSSIFLASILATALGGWLSGTGQQQLAFLICGGTAVAALVMTIFLLDDPPVQRRPHALRTALGNLKAAVSSSVVWAVGLFLLLWHFNPFTDSVLYLHSTKALGISEEFYGYAGSVQNVASMAGSMLFGLYCRRLTRQALVHQAILMGIVCTLAYALVRGPATLMVANIIYGFAYASATLALLDLAAQACPPAVAGTTFGVLMALANLGQTLAQAVGGNCYKLMGDYAGRPAAFQFLVGLGAATTAMCWLLWPLMRRAFARSAAERLVNPTQGGART